MDVLELTQVLFDDSNPSIKICLQLQVEENDQEVEGASSDLFELLVNIVTIGIMRFQLQLASLEDLPNIKHRLQRYFNKLDVNIFATPIDANQELYDSLPYCEILFDDSTQEFSLAIQKKVNNNNHSKQQLSSYWAVYRLRSGDYIKIYFGFRTGRS